MNETDIRRLQVAGKNKLEISAASRLSVAPMMDGSDSAVFSVD
ncbi:hypothetical protein ACP2AV_08170 [Aliiroseovarius sp. PTFE2010]